MALYRSDYNSSTASSYGTLIATYEYDPYGRPLGIYNTSGTEISQTASHIAAFNPFRYRGYRYDGDTGLYYLESRYYDPVVGRFINGDSYTSTGQGFLGCNMFAYCGNNPATRKDSNGDAWETVWDVLSLASSVVEVAANPYDPWAWIALAGDAADVLIPFIGGIGETTKALKAASQAAEAVDTITDAKKGWKVGEDITNLTKAGNVPSWSTLRSRYWKNKAYFFKADYSTNDLNRMKKGLAPLVEDGGDLVSMELHHILGRESEKFYFFFEVTPSQHAQIDPYRFLGR